ncbi:MAG: hypothetical protein R8K49_04020 [Mariprofundaceae bacterium]
MLLKRFFLLILLCISYSSTLQAQQEDQRFHIQLHFETLPTPELQLQVQQALPLLWNKIIPKNARDNMPRNLKAMSLLQRVQPQGHDTNIQFNATRIWTILQQRQIPHIKQQPSFQLHFTLNNAFGQKMQQSELELLTYMQQQSELIGIQLTQTAPRLNIRMQWLNDRDVQLSVRGQSRLSEFSETHNLGLGDDPLPQLQQWLLSTLTKARDSYIWKPELDQPVLDLNNNPTNQTFNITIEQAASLSEQIALESALENDPRVSSLIPAHLNRLSRSYHIVFKDPSNYNWISDWFAKRGMFSTRNAQGWIVQ